MWSGGRAAVFRKKTGVETGDSSSDDAGFNRGPILSASLPPR